MVNEKLSHRVLASVLRVAVFVFIAAFFALLSPHNSYAVTTEAVKITSKDTVSIIEGLKVRQIGSDTMIVEFRGTKLTLPYAVSDLKYALVLEWPDIRFPRNTDKQAWWDEYGWDILKIDRKKSDNWGQKYDFPLFQRIEVTSTDVGGIKMCITAEKPLNIKTVSGMSGSDVITLQLQADSGIVPPKAPAPRVMQPGDPLGMYTPVTLELRDVSVKDVLRLLANLRNLNLIIDPSVPDNTMTFSFKNAKFSEVFAYMLRMNDLTYALMGKTLVVGTSDSIGKTLGRNQTREYKVAYGEMSKLPAIIMGVVPLAKAPVADERLRTLYVTATPEQHIEIEALMNRIDHPGKQVMLQARLIEINDNAKQEIETMISSVYRGWIFSYGASGLSSEYTYGNGLITPNVNPSSSSTPGTLPIVGTTESTIPVNIVNSSMKMLDAGLRAMESDNKGKILANPSVVALDGQKASIKLTHNYLYQSGLDESGNPEFTEQETGPTLDITPTIGRDGFVSLKLKISTGEIVDFRKSGVSEVPETTKREIDTQIRVRNGELFVIGGLYQESKSKGITRVPIISYIPIIGELFKTKSDKHIKSELAFIVVPYILDVPTSAAEVYKMPVKSLSQ